MARFKAGDRVGIHVLIRPTERGWLIRCRCGNVRDICPSGVSNLKNGRQERCYKCRAKGKTRLSQCVGCSRTLRRSIYGAPGRCGPCKRRAESTRRSMSQTEERGRRCIGCNRTDAETRWSKVLRHCDACNRMAAPSRNGECSCGSPLLATGGCRAKSWGGCKATLG